MLGTDYQTDKQPPRRRRRPSLLSLLQLTLSRLQAIPLHHQSPVTHSQTLQFPSSRSIPPSPSSSTLQIPPTHRPHRTQIRHQFNSPSNFAIWVGTKIPQRFRPTKFSGCRFTIVGWLQFEEFTLLGYEKLPGF